MILTNNIVSLAVVETYIIYDQIHDRRCLDLVAKFHNTIIFSTSDTILAQRFLGIQQNQCFALFQRRRLCDDVFSTLADEFGDFVAVFGTALKERNQTISYKKHGGISAYRKAFLSL